MDLSENLFITIERPKAYNWKPRPDITAYELALAIPILSFHTFDTEARIEALPERVRRHFEEVEEESK